MIPTFVDMIEQRESRCYGKMWCFNSIFFMIDEVGGIPDLVTKIFGSSLGF